MKSPLQNETTLPQRLAREDLGLTVRERALTGTLLQDYPHALLESATALAGRCGTSASTVVRFFAKLGYSSYAEAQREARAEVTARLQTAAQRAPVTLGAQRSLEACVDDTLLHDLHNIQATHQGLDLPAFKAMAQRLAEDRGRIYVLGLLNSAPVASWLALHLNMCRPGVQELGAGAISAIDQLAWIGPDDVLLAFSVRRYAATSVQLAQRFQAAGAQVLALTDSAAAPLARHATHRLQVHTSNASPFNSYTSAFFLGNALIAAVAQLRRDAIAQALTRRDALWQNFDQQLMAEDLQRRAQDSSAGAAPVPPRRRTRKGA